MASLLDSAEMRRRGSRGAVVPVRRGERAELRRQLPRPGQHRPGARVRRHEGRGSTSTNRPRLRWLDSAETRRNCRRSCCLPELLTELLSELLSGAFNATPSSSPSSCPELLLPPRAAVDHIHIKMLQDVFGAALDTTKTGKRSCYFVVVLAARQSCTGVVVVLYLALLQASPEYKGATARWSMKGVICARNGNLHEKILVFDGHRQQDHRLELQQLQGRPPPLQQLRDRPPRAPAAARGDIQQRRTAGSSSGGGGRREGRRSPAGARQRARPGGPPAPGYQDATGAGLRRQDARVAGICRRQGARGAGLHRREARANP